MMLMELNMNSNLNYKVYKLCRITSTFYFLPGLFPTDGRFVKFNGGFSQDQLDWLNGVLTSADQKEEKVTVVSAYSLLSTTKYFTQRNDF